MSSNKWSFTKQPISMGRQPTSGPTGPKRQPQSRASVLHAQQAKQQLLQQRQSVKEPEPNPESGNNTNSSIGRESIGHIAPPSAPLLRDSYNNDFEDYIRSAHSANRGNSDEEVITVRPSERPSLSKPDAKPPALSIRRPESTTTTRSPSTHLKPNDHGSESTVKTIKISPTKPNKSSRFSSTTERQFDELMSGSGRNNSHTTTKNVPKKKPAGYNGWVKTEPSKQDEISTDAKEFGKRFEGYIEIKPEEYATIQPDTWIRYMKHNPNSKYGFDYRSGGKVVKNKFPEFWILKPTYGNGKSWCVPLKGENRYFRRNMDEVKNIYSQKQRLYNAVKDGDLMLMSKEEFKALKAKLDKLEGRTN